jgi:hypothetical protein
MPLRSPNHLPASGEQTSQDKDNRPQAQSVEAAKARSNIWFVHGWMLTLARAGFKSQVSGPKSQVSKPFRLAA